MLKFHKISFRYNHVRKNVGSDVLVPARVDPHVNTHRTEFPRWLSVPGRYQGPKSNTGTDLVPLVGLTEPDPLLRMSVDHANEFFSACANIAIKVEFGPFGQFHEERACSV